MLDNGLGRLGELFLLKAIRRRSVEIRHEAHAYLVQAAVMAMAIMVGTVTLVLGLVALYMYLCESMAPLYAVSWMAGGFLLLTIFLWLMAFLLPQCRPEKQDTPVSGQGGASDDPVAALLSDVATMIAEHPGKASIAALAAGLVVGYFPEVRSVLLKVLAETKNQEKPKA